MTKPSDKKIKHTTVGCSVWKYYPFESNNQPEKSNVIIEELKNSWTLQHTSVIKKGFY